MASFLLPSLRASSSSTCSSCPPPPLLALSRRGVKHNPRLPNVPKFTPNDHPSSFVSVLPSGASFKYNPAPSQAPTASTVQTLQGELSPNGKQLPLAWRKVPGFGFKAPRVDKLSDTGGVNEGMRVVVPDEVRQEVKRLRAEDPVKWTRGSLAKKFNLPPHLISTLAPAPTSYIAQASHDASVRLERLPLRKLVALEGRRLRKTQW